MILLPYINGSILPQDSVTSGSGLHQTYFFLTGEKSISLDLTAPYETTNIKTADTKKMKGTYN